LCLARNQRRIRQVPQDIIFRMHRQIWDAPPSLEEGIDELFSYLQWQVCVNFRCSFSIYHSLLWVIFVYLIIRLF
ncbi:MAG: AAA family ATPase, partial [Dolichospermum sp.]